MTKVFVEFYVAGCDHGFTTISATLDGETEERKTNSYRGPIHQYIDFGFVAVSKEVPRKLVASFHTHDLRPAPHTWYVRAYVYY